MALLSGVTLLRAYTCFSSRCPWLCPSIEASCRGVAHQLQSQKGSATSQAFHISARLSRSPFISEYGDREPVPFFCFFFFFFFTLVTGSRRSSNLKLGDTRVYEPQIRALLGTDSHFCEVVVLKLRTVPQVTSLDFTPDGSLLLTGSESSLLTTYWSEST